MASSLTFLLFVSLSLSFSVFSITQADSISSVCSRTLTPSLCNKILRSDPRSRGADLRGLGLIAIDHSKPAVRTAKTAAKSVRDSITNSTLEVCLEVFHNAIDSLNDCRAPLKKRGAMTLSDVDDLKTWASAAEADVGTCDEAFEDGPDVEEPAKLRDATGRAGDIIGVLLSVAHVLGEQIK